LPSPHAAAGTARRAELLHRLVLGKVLGPVLDVLVDLSRVIAALRRRGEPRVLLQILAPDHLAQPLPMRVCGATSVDEDVVVRAFRLALEDLAGRIAEHDAIAVALACLVSEKLAGIGGWGKSCHRGLDRDLTFFARTCRL